MSLITIERKVLEKNDEIARQNREQFERKRIFSLNIVSSPGSGKTSILERTIDMLKSAIPLGVIEGDVQTDIDARRVARFGIPAVQIVTRGGCHLEASLVRDAIAQLDLSSLHLVFIENVGNLVCPSGYDLGEAMKVVVISTSEGDDKPLKYPAMFRAASVMIINKIDLLPYVDCSIETLEANALKINPALKVFRMSCRTAEGVREWCDWLTRQVRSRAQGEQLLS